MIGLMDLRSADAMKVVRTSLLIVLQIDAPLMTSPFEFVLMELTMGLMMGFQSMEFLIDLSFEMLKLMTLLIGKCL